MIGGRDFVKTFVGDCGLDERRPPLSLRTLVLRPSDAKKPVPEPFTPGSGSGNCSVFVGESRRVDDRAGAR